ncbi:MAG: hypothetical protein V4695_13170 [Pseudomonadota bacterium]
MPSSSLDPDNILENDRQLGKGHGLDALGPSDMSDTGSDALGAYTDGDVAIGTEIGFDRIATTDLPYDPMLEIDAARESGIDSEVDAELALDPTMDLDLAAIADLDSEVDTEELLGEDETAEDDADA